MKVTFLRLGHANNSSSSHSIIFTAQPLKNSGESDFGWEHFTCASKEDKKRYFLATLWSAWRKECGVEFGYGRDFYIDTLPLSLELENQFTEWGNKYFAGIFPAEFDVIEDIDHQSLLRIPKNRITGLLDVEFVRELFKELILTNYAVLGGNDNGDANHPLLDRNERDKDDPVAVIYYFLKDTANIQSLKDTLTGEWILSRNDGPVMKIKIGAK